MRVWQAIKGLSMCAVISFIVGCGGGSGGGDNGVDPETPTSSVQSITLNGHNIEISDIYKRGYRGLETVMTEVNTLYPVTDNETISEQEIIYEMELDERQFGKQGQGIARITLTLER